MELFRQAMVIMVLGMSLVFLFLWMVILCMTFAAKMIRRYEAGQPSAPEAAVAAAVRSRLAAAIAVATECPPAKR